MQSSLYRSPSSLSNTTAVAVAVAIRRSTTPSSSSSGRCCCCYCCRSCISCRCSNTITIKYTHKRYNKKMKLRSNARKDIRSRCEDIDPQKLPDKPDLGAKFKKKRKRQSSVSRQPEQVASLLCIANIFGSANQHRQVQETFKRL